MKKVIASFLIFLLLIFLISIGLYASNDADKLKNKFTHYNLKSSSYELLTKKPKSWTSISQISKEALWAIIVSEDWAFYDHRGVDLRQIKVAIEDKVIEGDKIRGASTISQQVVKNAFYSNKRSYIRKFKELIGTIKLEQILTKDEILEQYINLAEFGKDLYGIHAAAKYYFKKTPKDLSAKEGAFLAMLLPSPVKYSISFRQGRLTDYAQSTIDKILVKLRQAKIITEEQRLDENRSYLRFEDEKIMESFF
jgi:monofunctional biosynthetic peptidoglycan transglycosylase